MILKTTFRKSKVARRIFALFVLCALLPIIAFAGISFRQIAKQRDEQCKRRIHKATKSVSKQEGGALTVIRTNGCDDKVCVDVEDNGPGIPDDIQKNMFNHSSPQRVLKRARVWDSRLASP